VLCACVNEGYGREGRMYILKHDDSDGIIENAFTEYNTVELRVDFERVKYGENRLREK
jgi:oligoribonuclease NrnB/cAMP/cGMP phosphodiesterase (DHH superfamily)